MSEPWKVSEQYVMQYISLNLPTAVGCYISLCQRPIIHTTYMLALVCILTALHVCINAAGSLGEVN